MIFLFNWKITLNNKYLNYVTFHLKLTPYIFKIWSQFKTRLLFVVYQVTIHKKNAQNMLHLNECMNGHICSRNVAPFQRFGGCCEWFYRQKMRWWSISSFLIAAEHTRVLSVYTDENLKEWVVVNVGAVPWKLCLRTNTDMQVFFVLLRGTHSWTLSKHFR